MRIVLVCKGYPTHRPGGMLFVVQDRAEALAKLGHDVHVITTGRPASGVEYLNGVNIHYTQSKPLTYTTDFATEAEQIVRSLKPKVLHFDSFDASRPWWTSLTDIPCTALTLHGFGMGAFLTKWNLYREGVSPSPPVFDGERMQREAKLVATTFNTVLAISRHELWMLRDCYNVQQARLLHNPIADKFFTAEAAQRQGKSFLCAAISGQHERGFRLAEQAAEQAKVQLRTVNDVDRDMMPYVYDESEAVVLPTFYSQGFDLTVAEALARRRPVIVSATGSYLAESEHFYPFIRLVPQNDVDGLAAAMSNPLPEVSDDAALMFRPYQHAQCWLGLVWPWVE